MYIFSCTGSLSNSTSPNVSPEVTEVFLTVHVLVLYIHVTCADYITSTVLSPFRSYMYIL